MEPNREELDDKIIGSRKRKINLMHVQKNVDVPGSETAVEEPSQASKAFSGITKWLTGAKNDALSGLSGPPVIEVHYEPKGDDDDFLSSIGSPRSVHSGDEGMLTSGDEFLSCDGDNDADDRLASVVSDVESVGSKKQNQEQPSQNFGTPTKSDESDSSFVTPENSWYDGTQATAVRKNGANGNHLGDSDTPVGKPSLDGANGNGNHKDDSATPVGNTCADDTPKQFTKIETEKTIRREFEGETIVKESEKTIRCETSHSSTGVTVHKERTETVVQKSSIQGLGVGGFTSAIKDAINVAAAAFTGQTSGDGKTTGALGSALKNMSNMAVVASPLTQISQTIRKEETKVPSGIAAALMGIGNIAAAASPSTHVSCEATKEHKVTVHHTTEKEDRIASATNFPDVQNSTNEKKQVKEEPKTAHELKIGSAFSISAAPTNIDNSHFLDVVKSNKQKQPEEKTYGNDKASKDLEIKIASVTTVAAPTVTTPAVAAPAVAAPAGAAPAVAAPAVAAPAVAAPAVAAPAVAAPAVAAPTVAAPTVAAPTVGAPAVAAPAVAAPAVAAPAVAAPAVAAPAVAAPAVAAPAVAAPAVAAPAVAAPAVAAPAVAAPAVAAPVVAAPAVAAPVVAAPVVAAPAVAAPAVAAPAVAAPAVAAPAVAAPVVAAPVVAAPVVAAPVVAAPVVAAPVVAAPAVAVPAVAAPAVAAPAVAAPAVAAPTVAAPALLNKSSVHAAEKDVISPSSAPITFVLSEEAKAEITQKLNEKVSSQANSSNITSYAAAAAVSVKSVLKEIVQSQASKALNHSDESKVTTNMSGPITFVMKGASEIKDTSKTLEKEVVSQPPVLENEVEMNETAELEASMDIKDEIEDYQGRDKRKYKKRKKGGDDFQVVYGKRKRKRDCVLLHEIYRQNLDFIMSPKPKIKAENPVQPTVTTSIKRPRNDDTPDTSSIKKRGRPKKYVETSLGTPLAKKAGRPKKYDTPNSSTVNKVGRSKKLDTPDATPGRRGRPRKYVNTPGEKIPIIKTKVQPIQRSKSRKIVSVSAGTGRGKYFKYSEMDRYVIGKYASQHGDYASAKLFMDSSDLRASTVHTCKLMYLAGRLAEPKKKINMIEYFKDLAKRHSEHVAPTKRSTITKTSTKIIKKKSVTTRPSISTNSKKKQNNLKKSLKKTHRNLTKNRKGITKTTKSLTKTQKSTKVTQKSTRVAQKSTKVAQKSTKVAQKSIKETQKIIKKTSDITKIKITSPKKGKKNDAQPAKEIPQKTAVDFEIVTPKPFGGGGLLSFMKPKPAFQGGGLLSFMKRPAVSSEVRKPEAGTGQTPFKKPTRSPFALKKREIAPPIPFVEDSPRGKYEEKDRVLIGKYATEHGLSHALNKFKVRYPSLKYVTVVGFKNRYLAQITEAKGKDSKKLKISTTAFTKKSKVLVKSSKVSKVTGNSITKAKVRKAKESLPTSSKEYASSKATALPIPAGKLSAKAQEAWNAWNYLPQIQRYECQLCGQTLKHKKHLAYHVLIHADEIPYECEICGVKQRSRSNLNRHMRKLHPDGVAKKKSTFKSQKTLAASNGRKQKGKRFR